MNETERLDSVFLMKLLRLLADGQFHSGEELGSLIGVSRSAVWKHLKKMEELGVKVLSVKGRGYSVVGGLDLLDYVEILACLDSSLLREITVLPHVDSTNSYLMRQKDRALHVCLTEFQSSGRGRRGRRWVSPFAKNIYCSIAWGFDGGVAALEGLSLAIGLAVVRTLQRYGVTGLKLKWPNDVLYANQKLAGILIEMTGDPAGYCEVVIGVGINVSMSNLDADSIDQPWIDLQKICLDQSLQPISRNKLAASLIDELIVVLADYGKQGFSAYFDEWQFYNAHQGKLVELINGNTHHQGVCMGVTETGALRIDMGLGEEIFNGGEISLRQMK
jgi:BirA family transcriptional regulator, biotin operon repressor / biotin---[acetyl-CoA-carboxylase] ligase